MLKYHLGAMAIASLLIFGFTVHDLDVQPLVGRFDDRWFHDYSPYFTGLNNLQEHEIFSPRYAHKKKIVLLGGSSANSLGCDSSWSTPDNTRNPKRNVAYFCSIAAKMNEQLQRSDFGNWRVFNLAADGSRLTPMLYVYARIAALKPEIIIYGDHMPYYRTNNADADSLEAEHWAYLDKAFNTNSNTVAIWRAYRETLMKHGWRPPTQTTAPRDISPLFQPRQRTTVSDILVRFMIMARNGRIADGPPLPIKFDLYRNWEVKPYVPYIFNPDPGLDYFQGFRLISELQRQHGGKLFFYFAPSYFRRHDLTYITALNDIFGTYLTKHGIAFASYVALGLKPIYETYDGSHQTMYGNQIVGTALLNDLKERRLLN